MTAALQAIYHKKGAVVDYYNSSSTDTVYGGTLVTVENGRRWGVVVDDILPLRTGSAQVKGLFKIVAAAVTITAGQEANWDTSATPNVVTNTTGTGKRKIGYFVADAASTDGYAYVDLNGIRPELGSFSSVAGDGLPLSSGLVAGFKVFADDAGAALPTSGTFKAGQFRTCITKDNSAGGESIFGAENHAKVTATGKGPGGSGSIAGAWNYVEILAGGYVTYAAGSRNMVSLPSTAVVNGCLAGLEIISDDLGGTHTGPCVGIDMQNALVGTWDAFARLGSQVAIAASGATLTATHKIPVSIGGNIVYILAGTSSS